MKIKAVFGGVLLVLFSMFFISNSSAGECSIEDPCQTYAIMDGNTVANIIVCQPSVCGSGFLGGKRVIPQVAADSTGQNRGGYYGTELDGTFTIPQSGPTNTAEEIIDEVKISVTMQGELKSTMTFEDTMNKSSNEWLTPVPLPVDTKVTISANSKTNSETLEFDERTSIEEFDWEVWISEFELLFFNINFFGMYLFSWGWFL
jgi:hypothetical protein